MSKSFLQSIFSVTNDNYYKIITILGFKIKLKNNSKVFLQNFSQLNKKLDCYKLESNHAVNILNKKLFNMENQIKVIRSDIKKNKEITPFDAHRNFDKGYIKYLETHIVDHCNLNCKACCHYCNVTDKNFIDINKFRSDFQELSAKFDIKLIRLMGGEPLLHPDVHQFLYVTREFFPYTEIFFVTNGTLLENASEDFWKAVRQTHTIIDVTKYPCVGEKFAKALDSIGNNTAHQLGRIFIATHFNKTMTYEPVNNIEESFNECKYKRCINLINGKLVHCPTAGYMEHYNKYFDEHLPEESGIDIYNNSALEIMDYLGKSIPTCAHCVPKGDLKKTMWEVSTRDKYEWFMDK